MNWCALSILLLLAAPAAQAHHTKEHILGAPQAPVIAPDPQATSPGTGFWLALGPFFALTAIGTVRWSYRRHRERKESSKRGGP